MRRQRGGTPQNSDCQRLHRSGAILQTAMAFKESPHHPSPLQRRLTVLGEGYEARCYAPPPLREARRRPRRPPPARCLLLATAAVFCAFLRAAALPFPFFFSVSLFSVEACASGCGVVERRTARRRRRRADVPEPPLPRLLRRCCLLTPLSLPAASLSLDVPECLSPFGVSLRRSSVVAGFSSTTKSSRCGRRSEREFPRVGRFLRGESSNSLTACS